MLGMQARQQGVLRHHFQTGPPDAVQHFGPGDHADRGLPRPQETPQTPLEHMQGVPAVIRQDDKIPGQAGEFPERRLPLLAAVQVLEEPDAHHSGKRRGPERQASNGIADDPPENPRFPGEPLQHLLHHGE